MLGGLCLLGRRYFPLERREGIWMWLCAYPPLLSMTRARFSQTPEVGQQTPGGLAGSMGPCIGVNIIMCVDMDVSMPGGYVYLGAFICVRIFLCASGTRT